MLEQLFGSKTRVRLLRLFLSNQDEAYFVRELTRKIGAQINAVRNELDNLLQMDLVEIDEHFADDVSGKSKRGRSSQQRKYYRLNKSAILYPELRSLFLKSRVLLEKDLIKKITKSGSVSYFALLGYFVGEDDAPTDALIVGRVKKEKLTTMMRNFEREIGREINYTVMTPQEFRYRKDLTDRFLYGILESRKIVVCDTISERTAVPAV